MTTLRRSTETETGDACAELGQGSNRRRVQEARRRFEYPKHWTLSAMMNPALCCNSVASCKFALINEGLY